jgi:acyl-CoA synthetase (AMP-forming)/AMP-acid ligase II
MSRGGVAVAVPGRFDTISELMDAAASQIGDAEAYVEVDTGRRLTFGEWIDAADRVATALVVAGVRPGEVVAVHLPPSIDYAVACAAALRMGAVVTGVNARLGPREVAAILHRCRPAALIVSDDGCAPGGDWAPGVMFTRSALASALATCPRHLPASRSSEDPAVIIWTSGTTGEPKGAWFDHRNLAAAVGAAGPMAAPFDRRVSAIPLAHAGYMAKIWEQLAFGITLVLTPTPWTAATMLDVLERERITAGAGVPTQWAKLLELDDVGRADLGALRVCLAATAPAPPELIARMVKVLGAPVVVRYAMTECPSITGTSPGDRPDVLSCTVGRPQAGMTVDLVGEDGAVVPAGEVGRVRVSGPCVMRGYWEDPAGTADAIDADGRLLSTDLGRFDGDGNLILVGRTSEMYIRGGYNVYPLEVEHVLTEHPAIEAAAVVGVPRPVIGEIGLAFIVPAPGASAPTLAELRRWVTGRLADYKAPDELRVVAALPLTPMMKVDKAALRCRDNV